MAGSHHQERTALKLLIVFLQHPVEVFDLGLKGSPWEPKENDACWGESLLKDQLSKIAVSDNQNMLGYRWRMVRQALTRRSGRSASSPAGRLSSHASRADLYSTPQPSPRAVSGRGAPIPGRPQPIAADRLRQCPFHSSTPFILLLAFLTAHPRPRCLHRLVLRA